MAAIDLERGLEHGGRGWGSERSDLMDNFDSEMQEWEDQLQDIQRKIEELYSSVQARRGASDVTADNQRKLEYKQGHHSNSQQSQNPSGPITQSYCYSNGCNYGANTCGFPANHQNGYAYCHASGVSDIGDLLQDYLKQGKHMGRKNNGTRHVHFSDTIDVSSDTPVYNNDVRRNERVGTELRLGSFEESENRKNQMSNMAGYQHRGSSPNQENKLAKPPLGQRDASTVQPRVQLSHSPALDRKCCSPSVLRKFGAMLQENEGKLLTESGVVTHQRLTPEPKCPTPSCQRRAVGANAAASKASVRVASQKSQADPDMLTGEIELNQDWVLVSDSGRQSQKDQRGGYNSPKGSRQSPQPSHRRPLATGSPKVKPRANSGPDRDGGLVQRERARKVSPPSVEPRLDHRVSSVSSGSQWVQRGGLTGQDCRGARDEGLIELLDMLEIQHEYRFSSRPAHTSCRDDPQQAELSLPAGNRSFSRPARPANQRPPSRWASRTPTVRITSLSGPLYRPPSPMTRTPSPASKHRPLLSYALQTETVIM